MGARHRGILDGHILRRADLVSVKKVNGSDGIACTIGAGADGNDGGDVHRAAFRALAIWPRRTL